MEFFFNNSQCLNNLPRVSLPNHMKNLKNQRPQIKLFQDTPKTQIKNQIKKKIVISTTKNIHKKESNYCTDYNPLIKYPNTQWYNPDKQNIKCSINQINFKNSQQLKKKIEFSQQKQQQYPFYLQTSQNSCDLIQITVEKPTLIDLKKLAKVYIRQIKNLREGISILNNIVFKKSFKKIFNSCQVCDLSSIKKEHRVIDMQKVKILQRFIKLIRIVNIRYGMSGIKKIWNNLIREQIYQAVNVIKQRQNQISCEQKKLGCRILFLDLKNINMKNKRDIFQIMKKHQKKRIRNIQIQTISTPNFHSKHYSFCKFYQE